jgi:perosamine synthetase
MERSEGMIPLSVPNLSGNEKKYVIDALENGWVSTAGSYVSVFEHKITSYLKTSGAVALQSGTAALHLALKLSGVRDRDEVIVPTLTFIAAVNPVKYLGAEPIFMDCDDSLAIDCDKVEDFLQNECEMTRNGVRNRKSKRFIRAIVVVHVFGNMANVMRLRELADQYDIKLIEDATEALGTHYNEDYVKGCFAGTIGDFGAYSFNGNKIITTGGGGMLVAKDKNQLEKARYLSMQAKDDPVSYVHHEVGYNYRMTNLQAALGVAQLEQLEGFVEIKNKNYQHYLNLLKGSDCFFLLPFNPIARNNQWFYTLYLQKEAVTREIIDKLRIEHAIEIRPIWHLIHTQRMYLKNQSYYIDKAPIYWEHCINLPCSTNLTKEDITYVSQSCKCLFV